MLVIFKGSSSSPRIFLERMSNAWSSFGTDADGSVYESKNMPLFPTVTKHVIHMGLFTMQKYATCFQQSQTCDT